MQTPTPTSKDKLRQAGLMPIDGHLSARTRTVRDRFPNLDDSQVAWVAQNFDFIVDSPVFAYQDEEGGQWAAETHNRRVAEDSYLRREPGLITIIYSFILIMTFEAISLRRVYVWNVKMTSIQDSEFLSKRRSDRIWDALS